MKSSIKSLAKNSETLLKAGLVPLVRSSPGVGKTSVIRQMAEALNLKVIDIRLSQCDTTDLNGFPSIDKVTGKASYLPMDTFPLEGDSLPVKTWKTVKTVDPKDPKKITTSTVADTHYAGWMIIYDELTSAAPAIQAAAYKILLEREVGQRKLHRNVWQIGLGNKETDNAVVARMSTALQSRLIHLEIESDPEEWLKWAMLHSFDPRIIAYISHKPDSLNKFSPTHNDHTFPCERTWEFVNKILTQLKKDHVASGATTSFQVTYAHQVMLAGAIGEGASTEFIAFCEIYGQLLTIPQIVANPIGVQMPDEPSAKYAIAALIGAEIDINNCSPLMKFVSRMDIEFQILCVRMFYATKTDLRANPAVAQWVHDNVRYLKD